MRYFLLGFFHIMVLGLFAQTQRDSIVERERFDTVRLVLHFDTDSYVISEAERTKANAFLQKNWHLDKTSVVLTGHTDSDASDAYNELLSQRRCASVAALIAKQNAPFEQMEVHPFGERQLLAEEKAPADKALNRRVEVSIVHRVKYKVHIPCGGFDPCPDTLIVLPQGSYFRLDRCWLRRHPECVSITEYITPEAARQGGFSTEDSRGDGLRSGGMLQFDICRDTIINVYIPVNEDCPPGEMFLYSLDNNGRWQRLNNQPVRVVQNSGVPYFEVPLSGRGVINCDAPMGRPVRTPKVVFKATKDLRLQEVVWSCDCPFTIQVGRSKRNKGKKIKFARVCCPELQVKVTALDKEGKTLELPFGDIDRFTHAKAVFGCKSEERKRWFIFKIRKKNVYRRYKIRKTDFS